MPSSNDTPARAAGQATASASSAGDSGVTTNAPSPTSEPIVWVLQRPVEQIGPDRRHHPDVVERRRQRDEVEELVASVRPAACPALLQLVHDDHQRVPPGDRRQGGRQIVGGASVDTSLSAVRKLSTGSPPGTIVTTVRPAARRRGTSPAATSELLPDPDAPTTVTSDRRPTMSARASTIAARPKNLAASASPNARNPTYGFAAAAVSTTSRRASRRRASSAARRSLDSDRAEHTLRATDGRPPAQDQLGHRFVATLRGRRPGEHGIQPLGHRGEQPGERGDGTLLGRPAHRRAGTTRG